MLGLQLWAQSSYLAPTLSTSTGVGYPDVASETCTTPREEWAPVLAQRQMDTTQSKEGAAAGSKVVVAGDKWDWQSLDPLHPILHSALQSPTWRFSSLRQQNSQWVWGFSSEETFGSPRSAARCNSGHFRITATGTAPGIGLGYQWAILHTSPQK